MSTFIRVTPESIQHEIEVLNSRYQQELQKGSVLAIRKVIRLKIKELEATLDSLLKTTYPHIFQ
jgi:hypothetical protein